MDTKFNQLSNQVNCFMDILVKECFEGNSGSDCIEGATEKALKMLTEKYGTEEYGFNLSIEIFVERFSKYIQSQLVSLLEKNLPDPSPFVVHDSKKSDIAFAALYALSLVHKKENEIEKLSNLISAKYNSLRGYVLYCEVESRYYKRVKKYTDAILCDECAIKGLESRGIINYGLCISFASTVSCMYENGCPVTGKYAAQAKDYIARAISYNPEYPKYHFIKGKLLFFSSRSEPDFYKFREKCQEAIDSVKLALMKLRTMHNGVSSHYIEESQVYNSLIDLISSHLEKRKTNAGTLQTFLQYTDEQYSEIKHKIIESNCDKECLPPRPNIKPGEKFFFVCYSSKDYKSVFCDLTELYKNRIPFLYDETLIHGENWVSQIRNSIADEQCAGVVFYLSKNTVLSSALEQEIKMVCDEFKETRTYFCVNLEGRTSPSDILIDVLKATPKSKLKESGTDGERMRIFLNAFRDNVVFTAKEPENGVDGTAHFDDYLKAIQKSFGIARRLSTPSLL